MGESEGRETEKHFVPQNGVNLMKPVGKEKEKNVKGANKNCSVKSDMSLSI